MLLREIDHPKVDIYLYDDGYIHVHFKDNTVIDVQLQDELLNIYLELTEGKLYRFLFTGGEFVSITKEARYHANEIEDISPLGASAIVLSNLAHKIIADFYYRINKPKRPYKVFWSKEKAVKWLLDSDFGF
ncbi:MAG: hypothetical protein EP305_00910 [Bacteroidetes bacterium]|nr:MAG: hypothetical protein EP305_00910 [Bacteroidota bacterium]